MVDYAILSAHFAFGVAAFFSPCGFPMLPAFVAYYLGNEGSAAGAAPAERSVVRDGLRGLLGGSFAGLGAFAVLALVGVLAATLGAPFKQRILLLELIGGIVVIALGVATLAGKDFSFTPRVQAGQKRGFIGLAAFGALYAAVAAGCVAPIFIGVVFVSLTAPTAFLTFLYVAAYAFGLGLLLVALTVAVSVAGVALVKRLNAVLPFVKKAGGVIMIGVGLYLIWFWAEVEFFLV